jgi:ferritin heavy chain
MFRFLVLCALLVSASADFCYSDIHNACKSTHKKVGPATPNCNAKYGNIDLLEADLQAYANGHIETSFEFLLISTHFGNYDANREGFKGLFRKLSDTAWDKAIDIIKYISQRGGRMNFNQPSHRDVASITREFQLSEIESLAKALDTEKQLAKEGMALHAKATTTTHSDAGIAHYIEEEFMEPQSEIIRTLAGHTSDLKSMLNPHDAALSIFLFDEYLKKLS